MSGKHLSNIFVKLVQYPGMSLVSVGDPEDRSEEPVYVARAKYQGSKIPAYCGFQFPGAWVIAGRQKILVQRYEVLIAKPEQYQWRTVTRSDGLSFIEMPGVVFGGIPRSPDDSIDGLEIFRWKGIDENWVCSVHEEVPPGGSGSSSEEIAMLIRAGDHPSRSPRVSSSSTIPAAAVIVGRYWTDNHWSHVRPAGHYSTAVNFAQPLQTVPKIIVGINKLDMSGDPSGRAGPTIRIRTWPQNITKEYFICNAETWHGTTLYNASVDWAAIEEPSWQCGVLRTTDIRKPQGEGDSIFDHRVSFQTPFTSPPLVFACFSSFDMGGNWNLRTYATNIDHTGFSISVVKSNDGDEKTKLWSASVTWLAIPGDVVGLGVVTWRCWRRGRRVVDWGGSTGPSPLDHSFCTPSRPITIVVMKFMTIFTLAALALGVAARPRPQDSEGVPGGEEAPPDIPPVEPPQTVVDPETTTDPFTIQTDTVVETTTATDLSTTSEVLTTTTTSTSLTSSPSTTSTSSTRTSTTSTPVVSTNPASTVTAPPENGAVRFGATPNGLLAAVAAAALAAWL
ncbi:hypothetical protein NMY22_g5392 [Coprinellus aureogranulatus]|nr:hypothetical protein NMY22_g5392 [Coprinellus aureogranulatus]